MIRLKTIRVEEFRGVRDLTLELSGTNFGICGPNGTGKSGIVDAIEFCLTGDVTRLSGAGTAGISVRTHAPHVDQQHHPERARVTITADIPSLGKTVTIKRSVKAPQQLDVTPDGPKIRAVIDDVQTHPEFALSRREIVKYIITPPGQRSKDVQTLLRLDHLERLRKSFTTFRNRCKTQAQQNEHTRVTSEIDLRNALAISQLNRALVLEKVNEKRELLGLQALSEFTKETSFKDGAVTPESENEQGPKTRKASLSKKAALSDLMALRSAIKQGEPDELAHDADAIKTKLKQLQDDEKALALARRHGFIKTGLELVTEDTCPLCDTPWNADDLRKHLKSKLLSAQAVDALLKDLNEAISGVLSALSARIQAIEHAVQYCKTVTPALAHVELDSYLADLQGIQDALSRFQQDHAAIKPAQAAIEQSWWLPAAAAQARIDECYVALGALPDVSAEQEARDYLVVAQDRYEKLLAATSAAKASRARANVAEKVLDHYTNTCTAVLEGIYDNVAKDFSNYYRIINRDDEEQFVGKLTSLPAKLNFDVDFYGRGLFPPGAYHSEGHQDGMGLCLYLALMKHTLGDNFTFAVLDDVLMSVDTGHRREVCRLLKSQFPKTQFILTTHDRVWLQYMKTENLIARSQLFGGWTVDSGPRVWDDHDIWTEINNELDKEDVAKAAWLLRRYLEYTASILADNLRAPVEFRGDGHYDLSDLMPPVLKGWREKLREGEESAIHWKQDAAKTGLQEMRKKAKALVAKTNVGQWAINPSVHFNEWANLDAHEFREVVESFKDLLVHLRCEQPACKSYVYLSPRKGSAEALRCNCGVTNINLRKTN